MVGGDGICELAHGVERGEVGSVPATPLVPGLVRDLVERVPAALVVASVDEHLRPGTGELDGDGLAEPVGRARDEDGEVGDRTHAARPTWAAGVPTPRE